MFKVLNKPYPSNKGIKDSLMISFLIGLFILGFLFLFRPFNDIVTYSYTIVVGFSLITFIVSFLIAAILPMFFKNYFSEHNWTVGKEIIHIGFIVFSIGVVNFFFDELFEVHSKVVGDHNYIYKFFLSIGITFLIGFIPIIILVLYNQTRLLKKYIKESEKINKNKQVKQGSASEIIFMGEGRDEKLKVKNESILFIKSENNYCEIHIKDEDKRKKKLLRVTLTTIENNLAGFDSFIRVHRSYIVNSNNIEQVSGSAQGYKLHFEGVEFTVPVSRNKSAQFKSMITR